MRGITVLALLALPAILAAQHVPVLNTNRPAAAPAGAYRYGNILFPGGIPAPHANTHAGRLGATIRGNPYPQGGMRPGVRPPRRPGRTVVVPYAVPVFMGGGYGYGYYPQQEPASNVTVVVPQQPVPNVVVNTYTSEKPAASPDESNVRVYEGPSATQSEPASSVRSIMDEKPTIYLVVLKDGTIRQAMGYWLKGDQVYYVTPQSVIEHVPANTVDVEQSVEFNKERNLDFDLKLP